MRSDAEYALDLGYELLMVADEIEAALVSPPPGLKARFDWCSLMLWTVDDIERQFQNVARAVGERLRGVIPAYATTCREEIMRLMPVANGLPQ